MTHAQVSNRLFVPLDGGAFTWFESRDKRFELQRHRRQFTERQVHTGKPVELRYGYSGKSLHGEVGAVIVGDDLRTLLDQVGYKKVVPPASSLEEAVTMAEKFVGSLGPFIMFEVELD